MNRRTIVAIFAVIAAGLAAGAILKYQAGNRETECTKQLFAMDTFMSFTAYGKESEAAVDAAIQEVQRLDDLLSTGSPSSEVSGINENGGGSVSEDTEAILKRAAEIYGTTGGVFDITIYPLMCLWGFPSQEYHVPAQEELEEILPLVDASRILLDGTEVVLGEGQQIDFGGIAKGYASARVMDIFQDYGITSGQVTLGGNVQVLNTKTDGSLWKVGIQDPDSDRGDVLAVVEVDNKAVITSGGYERYFEEDGNTYIHIIDPRSGYPADNGLTSVTVVSDDGTLADALSTSLYIMGLEDAVSYWETYSDDFDMVLVTDEKHVYVTEGISGHFETNEEVTVLHTEEK